jgi:tetratricopeptide (TPR) repeat protein
MATTSSGLSLLRTLSLSLAAIAAFFLIDTVLSRTERAESRAAAARAYEAGMRLMKQGQSLDAVGQFDEAISLARDNPAYPLARAQALLAAGHLPEAEATLADLLQNNATAGAPNLAMARVLAKEGKFTDAVSYYHRAIYGRWISDPTRNRVQARSELVDFLMANHSTDGLLAELLPLEQEAPGDLATQKQLALAFTEAGSPARGAELFRDILRRESQDPDAHAGLGEAEFARGNYRAARVNFEAALRLRPADEASRQRLDLSNQVLAVDPAQRGLSREEQYQRSLKILELTVASATSCLASPISATTRDLIDSANKGLKQRIHPAQDLEAMEKNMQLAERIWQIRRIECKGVNPTAVDLVLGKATQ